MISNSWAERLRMIEEGARSLACQFRYGNSYLRYHAFIWDPIGHGSNPSERYNVVRKPQSGMDRFLVQGVGKQGGLATLDNAISNAGQFGLTRDKARDLVEEMAAVLNEWRDYFEGVGVPRREGDLVATAFRNPKELGLECLKKRRPSKTIQAAA